MCAVAGASIVSPPSNEIYDAMQTGVVNGDRHQPGSRSDWLGSGEEPDRAGRQVLWFMLEPVIMSKQSFDKLNKEQQDASSGAGKEVQECYEGMADGQEGRQGLRGQGQGRRP